LRRGRFLTRADIDTKKHVAVVNETLARRYFAEEDPIGRKIKFEVFDRPFVDAPRNTYFEIVGVVADLKTRPDRREYTLRPEAFLPASTAAFGYPLHILAKTSVDPHTLVRSFSQQVWAVDPDVAISGAGSVEDLLREDFHGPRFEGMILGTFAVFGLGLVAIGIFSVTSYSVSVRTKEIGVRMALGADRTTVLRLVLRRGLGQLAVGSLAGLSVSLVLTRFVRDLLWGTPANDPPVFAAAFAVLLLIGSAACVLPALQAAWVDPIVVLRCE
jgi:MacB-like periplasmic core domain